MSSSDNCNSRHFSRLMKSCFPETRPNPSLHYSPPPATAFLHRPTTISSLPDDIILEILSCVSHSSLRSISLVCRRWSQLTDSEEFYDLRRRRCLLDFAVFVVSFSESGFFAASYKLGHDSQWKATPLLFNNYDDAVSPVSYSALSSHARLAAIGRWIYIIGKTTVLRCDAWTGTVISRSKMSVLRKKFAVAVVAGKVYVAGGSTRSAAVEEYDPNRNAWRVVCHAPRMRYGCIGASVDGILYVIGGLKVGGACNDGTRVSAGGAHVYASSMDLYDVEARRWLRSRSVPGGGCMVAACSAGDHIYILASHAVELSFWRFNGSRRVGFGEWCRLKSPPLPTQIRLDGTVRFGCVGVGDNKVVLIQILGCIDDLLRRSGRSTRGVKEALVLVYDSGVEEWSRGADLPDVVRRAACVCVEW
ncbi:hypothetical protein SSX86_002801 [Deinandra increscens subsp. villosa]|uniref:F-box domain-containing protein n=1 Tax=Deinandra increscens subsp. villosa TaxID=3103831 RepID=A0AAP0DX53_9ASTR